jgi:hypothetical protein
MRARWAWAVVVALALGGSAGAQDFSSALTGVKPANVTFKQVDTAGVLRSPIATMNTSGTSGFSLTGFFRKLVGPSPKPIIGQSNIPVPLFKNAVMPSLPISSTVQR